MNISIIVESVIKYLVIKLVIKYSVLEYFLFDHSVIKSVTDNSVTESVKNYCMIRNWLFDDHLFCNGIGNQLFSNVLSFIIC